MKIVIDAQSIVKNRTGVGRYAFNLIKALARLDKNNTIIPFYFNFRRNFPTKDIFLGYKNIAPAEVKNIPGFIIQNLWKYSNLCPVNYFTGRSDIFHFPNFIVRPCKGKMAITIHDLAFKRFPDFISPANLKLLENKLKNSMDKADLIFTVSEFSKQEIQYFFPNIKTPIIVSPNGIDDFKVQIADNNELQYVKNIYKLANKFILHSGSLEPRKNLNKLLKAFKLVTNEIDDITLVLTGTGGWLNESFYKLIEELDLKNKLRFLGYIPDAHLKVIYQLTELFVFPTYYEGFGMPPLEAMAAGTKTLVADIPVLRENMANYTNYCAADASAKIWQQKILSSLEQKITPEIMQKRKEHALSFTWSKTAEITLQGYKIV